jgi:Na+-driven multidrug efflux pump
MFTFLIGLASATSVIIGNEIGANNEDGAYRQTREIIKLTFIMSLTIAILLYFLSPLILNVMNVRKSLYGIITTLLLVECVLIIGRALSMQFIVGVLRAGGDTMWTMWLDLLTIWLFVMPLTYYTALVLHWPLFIVYFISGSDEFIKLIPCIYRFKSRKWINNFTKV